MLLVKYQDSWAGDITVQGFAIYRDQRAFRDALQNFKDELDIDDNSEFSVMIGDDEEIEYRNITDLLDHCEIFEIEHWEYDAISKYLGDNYGIFPLFQ